MCQMVVCGRLVYAGIAGSEMGGVGVDTLGTTGRQLWLKILTTIGSLQRQTSREPYTTYHEMAPPLQAKEEGPLI
jgi:hypothetical protein